MPGSGVGRTWQAAAAAALLLAAQPVGAPSTPPPVAVSGLQVSPGLDDPDGVRLTFEPLVLHALEAGGFAPIAPAEADPVWDRHRRNIGPFFDPITGEERIGRLAAARRAALGELAASRGAIAWIRPAVERRPAPYDHGKASWDGATEGARPTGSGEVTGLSLALYLEGPDGRRVTEGRGGIQLWTKYSKWNSKFRVVQREDLFRDQKRNRAAVDRAMEPVLAALHDLPRPATVAAESLPPLPPPVASPPAEWPSLPTGTRAIVLRRAVVATGDVEVPSAVRDRYLHLVRTGLRSRGWTVVEAGPYEAAYRAAAIRIGGIFDRWTGAALPGRADSARSLARREAADHIPGAVILRPVLATVLATFRNEKASWHGVTEPVAEISALTKLLSTTTGQTEALSFAIVAEDANGHEIHRGMGGIQLVARLQGRRFVPVPPESLFADPSRDERAVELALRGFPAP